MITESYLLLAIVVDPLDQSIGIVTGSEMTSLMCMTQGIADRVKWERQDNEPLPIAATTSYMSLTSTLSITNIDDTNVGGRYQCVAYFSGQIVPSSYALLNVTGTYILHNMCFMLFKVQFISILYRNCLLFKW